jgi:excisionase family DNA binding protein
MAQVRSQASTLERIHLVTFDKDDLDALAEALTPRLSESLMEYFSGVFQPPKHSEVMNTEEAADFLKVDAQTIRREARKGRLPRHRVGRRNRFLKSDLLTAFKDPPGRYGGPPIPNRLNVALNN